MENKHWLFLFFLFGISLGLIIGSIYTIYEYHNQNQDAIDLLEECQNKIDDMKNVAKFNFNFSGGFKDEKFKI